MGPAGVLGSREHRGRLEFHTGAAGGAQQSLVGNDPAVGKLHDGLVHGIEGVAFVSQQHRQVGVEDPAAGHAQRRSRQGSGQQGVVVEMLRDDQCAHLVGLHPAQRTARHGEKVPDVSGGQLQNTGRDQHAQFRAMAPGQ